MVNDPELFAARDRLELLKAQDPAGVEPVLKQCRDEFGQSFSRASAKAVVACVEERYEAPDDAAYDEAEA